MFRFFCFFIFSDIAPFYLLNVPTLQVDAPDSAGCTALHLAVATGHLPTIQVAPRL